MIAGVMNDPRLRADPATGLYAVEGRPLPGVRDVLADVGLIGHKVRSGGRVREAIGRELAGALDDGAREAAIVPYLAGWRQFVATTGATIEHYGRPVCDPVAGYAGALDGVVVLPVPVGQIARRTVIVLCRAVGPSTGLEVAAYLRCARAFYEGSFIFNRAALVLPGDGTFRLEPLAEASDELTFLAATRIYHFRALHRLAIAGAA
jgi:hypothetical protein